MKHKQLGSAAIEFAIVLLPLLTIILGISEFGRAIYEYNTVAKAVRDATRYLTYQNAGDTTGAQSIASCMIRYGNYSSCVANSNYSGTLLAPGLSSVTITVCDSSTSPSPSGCNSSKLGGSTATCPTLTNAKQGTNPVINMVTVTVCGYKFTSAFLPFFANLASEKFGATITYDNISTTMRSQL